MGQLPVVSRKVGRGGSVTCGKQKVEGSVTCGKQKGRKGRVSYLW